MTAPATKEEASDPGGPDAAVNRYRDLTKYLVTIFAAVGALLAAGTQLSSLGRLNLNDYPGRLLAAGVALTVAIAVVVVVIVMALEVLRPVDMTFDQLMADPKLKTELEKRPGLLMGAANLAEMRELAENILDGDDDFGADVRSSWKTAVTRLLDQAIVIKVRSLFERAIKSMLAAGVVGAAAIAVFAWAVHPPDAPPGPVVSPKPSEVAITLTPGGREALATAIGKDCVKLPSIQAIAIGGTAAAPKLVTIPSHSCKPAQFALPAELGYPASTTPAPTPIPTATPKPTATRSP